ncbi:SseB family protein [Arthrobacter sp. I2-34]|uniref:SseB family protein n=1 Tax=Arthrobacter hankyongi TaxID=2904801 RepID=A0ABS9L124_9MICC|nr:SseB family protein [Arthrobacter hankyongi]MCG2620320.1 SseB family protein [Arthrobacter hankyongi]
MEKRELPGHIAAALAAAGGSADSAGIAWQGRDLSGPGNPLHQFDRDDGAADAGVLAARAALLAGTGTEAAVVAALATARVFVPVLAQLAQEAAGAHGLTEDKQADMALVTLQAPDGRRAMPVFTTTAALTAWHPEARPVAVFAPRAALSAVAEKAELLVLDPGAELTVVIRRPAVWALAKQHAWTPSYQDESLTDTVGAAVAGEPDVLRAQLAPGSGVASRTAGGSIVAGGGSGPELALVLQVRDGLGPAELQAMAGRIQQSLAADQQFAERVDSLEVKFTR